MSELFDDIASGLESYKQYKQGKITLKTTTLTKSKPLHITPSEIKSIREMLHLSQAVFAQRLRTSVRTYQGWEQGKSRPNAQAILLLRMVEQNPQTFEQIAQA